MGGNWEAELRPADNVYRIVSKSATYRASIADVFGTNDEDKANARLIASAPQMYEALESWSELWEMRPLDSGDDMQRILARCWAKTVKVLAEVDKET
jgi:hypothetical protein